MKLFQQIQELATQPATANPNPNLLQKFVKGSTLAVLSTTTSLLILLASINNSNNVVTSNSNTYDPTSLVSNLKFAGQSATAQVVSNGKAQKLDIKLIKTNKDGSQEYKVNGKTIKVTKKQIDTINLEIKKFYANEQLKITSFKENDYKKYIAKLLKKVSKSRSDQTKLELQ